jgi:hypothetical protein
MAGGGGQKNKGMYDLTTLPSAKITSKRNVCRSIGGLIMRGKPK